MKKLFKSSLTLLMVFSILSGGNLVAKADDATAPTVQNTADANAAKQARIAEKAAKKSAKEVAKQAKQAAKAAKEKAKIGRAHV